MTHFTSLTAYTIIYASVISGCISLRSMQDGNGDKMVYSDLFYIQKSIVL